MNFESRMGLFLIGLLGALLAFIGVCHAAVGDYFLGLLSFLIGFTIEAFALKTYIEEMTK